MKKGLLSLAMGMALTTGALAADLAPVKAINRALLAPVVPCDVTGCSGFYLGAEVSGSGSGVNVLNLASLNSGGTFMGVNGGYQFYNGVYWLGAKAKIDYAVAQQDPSVAGQPLLSLSNVFAFEGAEFGGNLSPLFGIAPINLPGPLANAVPTVLIGACQHGALRGYCAGAAAHFFIPNSRFTVDVDYLNAQYGPTNVSNIAGTPATISTENRGTFGFSYHF